jgi:hypothetical protein
MVIQNRIFLLVISIFIISIATLTVSFCLLSPNTFTSNVFSEHTSVLIGSADYGNVVKEGPLGNISSNVTIAYVVGVHPLESNAHLAAVDAIKAHDSSLKYRYYIYHVNVTKDANDYNKGRNNGQLLAQEFIVPNAVNQKFQLVVDVHSNVGNWAENIFIFAPVNGSSSESIGKEISNNISWLTYYIPPNPTSPEYMTIPLINSGIPSVIYETYSREPYQTTRNRTDEFITTVDNLNL